MTSLRDLPAPEAGWRLRRAVNLFEIALKNLNIKLRNSNYSPHLRLAAARWSAKLRNQANGHARMANCVVQVLAERYDAGQSDFLLQQIGARFGEHFKLNYAVLK